MRTLARVAAASSMVVVSTLAAVSLLAPTGPAVAQSGKGQKPAAGPAAEAVRYIMIFGETMGDLPSDAVWRETRQGNKVVSATLDVCWSVNAGSARKDRFVVALKPEGGKLVGSGQSEPGGKPVKVSLARNQSGSTFSVEGTITHGNQTEQVAASDLSDMSEAEFRAQQNAEDEIVPAPANFAEVAPGALAVRVSRDGFVDLVRSLRGKPVRIDYASLVQNCADLRSGRQMVRLETAPERAAALVAELKAMPGVEAAGWTSGAYAVERAVRVPAADWSDGGKLKAEALAARLSALLAEVLSANPAGQEWDEVTRELTLKFKRPDQAVRGLDLTELVEITLLVGPDKPAGGDGLVVWIGESSIDPADETAGPHLAFRSGYQANDEEAAAVETEAVMAALVKGLNGKVWDAENAAWK